MARLEKAGGLLPLRSPTKKINLSMIIRKELLGKIYRAGVWIMGAWLLIAAGIFFIYPAFRAYKMFVDIEYSTRVDSIEFRPAHHGHPHLKINSGWYLLTIDEMKVIPYLQVGDSIVKEKGATAIKVFRKDGNGKLIVKEFD